MKRPSLLALTVLAALAAAPCSAARLAETPVAMVVELIKGLETRIQEDGELEQRDYDKYACWCEETLVRKAKEISSAKELIEDLGNTIKELNGDIASHGAEIDQLEKDVAGNTEAQREAQELRKKERTEYDSVKMETEQCIGALEAAIGVLAGAGAGKKGFLETLQEAQLMSVVEGVRGLLGSPVVSKTISKKDLQVVKQFVSQPEGFVRGHARGLTAAQIANNPFGDYAPQSTQIQGILKGMYDAFVGDLEKANAQEAEQQKAFQELMTTKRTELGTLESTLEKQTLVKAEKSTKLAESNALRDDTEEQLKANEELFADIKAGCKVKAAEWSQRTRLRTEELHGIGQGIQILSSPDAVKTFENATTTFLQLSSKRSDMGMGSKGRARAYMQLKALASRFRSLNLARIAVAVKKDYFAEITKSIDRMIETLRKEDLADIAHRDRCQNAVSKNKNDLEDIDHAIEMTGKKMERLGNEIKDAEAELEAIEEDIEKTKSSMAEQLKLRNEEHADFKQAVQDDAAAVALLGQALQALGKFYERNKIPLALMRKKEPEYTVSADKAPKTSWEGANYGGRKTESQGILAILGMIREDLQKQIGNQRKEDAEAQKEYLETRAKTQEVLEAQIKSKSTVEQEMTELKGKKQDAEGYQAKKEGDKESTKSLEAAVDDDCTWVKTHFQKRRDARKAEMDGLVEAKGYLAGVDSGDELEP